MARFYFSNFTGQEQDEGVEFPSLAAAEADAVHAAITMARDAYASGQRQTRIMIADERGERRLTITISVDIERR
jgi:hypothetical protein